MGRLSDADRCLFSSCQLRCLHLRTANPGNAFRSFECSHRVGAQPFRPLACLVTADDRAVLASFLLNEELGHLGRLGCTLCLVGSLIIVLHAPEDKEVQTVDEILHYAIQPGEYHRSEPLRGFCRLICLPRLYDVLLHCYRVHAYHGLRHCSSIRSDESLHLHLDMLRRGFHLHYGH